ncbi:MAG: hypothetical protein MJA29_04045 [Candidatus Omnitrophica bacterium]|nr:hypothetical protein [Candidatus Omnitrophota bacterium]
MSTGTPHLLAFMRRDFPSFPFLPARHEPLLLFTPLEKSTDFQPAVIAG